MIIYVLELADGCFYVGRVAKDEDLDGRIEQHKAGGGAEWTKQHPVIGLHSAMYDAAPTDEDARVVSLVAEHGLDNVRGGTFCSPTLDEAELRILAKMADSVRGSCYHCHETGHCTSECPLSLSKAMSRGGDWDCPDCGNNVFARNKECPECGKWRPKDAKKTEPGKAGWKKGDWACPKCGDHQFAKNAKCRKCGTAKPAAAADALKRPRIEVTEVDEPEAKKPRTEDEKEAPDTPEEKAPGPELKTGDWLCPACSAHNYASRKACFKCHKVKPRAGAELAGTCAICLDAAAKVAAQPCGHLCLCEACSPLLGDSLCPICREPMTGKQTVYQ